MKCIKYSSKSHFKKNRKHHHESKIILLKLRDIYENNINIRGL